MLAAITSTPEAGERPVEIARLGDQHARLRLCGEEALRQMRHSLERHGQLTALVVYATAEGRLEIIDGFKRQRAAQQMGWTELRARQLGADVVAAAAAIVALNEGHGLTELEEGWLCRLLHRDHGLPQHEVGRWLGRHKSWVCRRLLLAEGLDGAVQAHVRLGLVAPRTASEIARLPRGNQLAAAEVVTRRGMTTAQTARLVQAVLSCSPKRGSTARRSATGAEARCDCAGKPSTRERSGMAMCATARRCARASGRRRCAFTRCSTTPLGM